MQWLKLTLLFVLFMLPASIFAAPKSGSAGVVWPPTPAKQRTVRQGSITYYLSPSFVLTAQNIKTHRLLWTTRYDPKRIIFPDLVTPTMVVAGSNELSLVSYKGIVYANDTQGITAIKAANGQQLWRASYGCDAPGPPTIQEGVIIISYESMGAISMGAIQARDARTGRFLWRYQGILSYKYSSRRKGYLICQIEAYPGSDITPGQKCLVNIRTGERRHL